MSRQVIIVEDNNGQPSLLLASSPQHADQIPDYVMRKMASLLDMGIDDATSVIEELMALGMEYLGDRRSGE